MAGIIKAGQAEQLLESGSSRAFEFGDISRLAVAEIEKAKQQAADIIAKAEERAATIEKEATVAGQQQANALAIAAAEKRVEKAIQPLLQSMAATAELIDQQRLQWQQDWEDQLMELACAIAEKVIRQELQRRPEISQQWIRELLEMASTETSAQLLLHPDDRATLGAQAERLQKSVARGMQLEVATDDHLQRGECRLIGRHSELDQRVTVQLGRILEELTGAPHDFRGPTATPNSSTPNSSTPTPPQADAPQVSEPPQGSEPGREPGGLTE